MNKVLRLVLLGVLVFPTLASASVDMNLKYGMKNTEVSELQDYLSDKGFLKVSPTGFFGLLTLKAVQEYQLSVNVPSTGYVGILTRGKINDELTLALASSTEAEIAETGTSTPVSPIISPQSPIGGAPVNPQPIINPTPNMQDVVLGSLSKVTRADYNPFTHQYTESIEGKALIGYLEMGDAEKVIFKFDSFDSSNQYSGISPKEYIMTFLDEDFGQTYTITSYDSSGSVLGTVTGTFTLSN